MNRGPSTVLSRRRFDVEEYHRMARAGVLADAERLELIHGEIVEMSALGSRHISCVGRLARAFVLALAERAFVTSPGAVRLGRDSELQPDLLVLRPRTDDYAGAIAGPEDALLVVEVAITSLQYDRDVKAPLYARFGVRELWLFDLGENAVHIHRSPGSDGYSEREQFTEGKLTPQALPDLALDIRELLPPQP